MTRYLEHRVVMPRERRHRRPLLLVHGAWHGAWCWERAMADFAGRGFAVHAISLRGHGASDPAPAFNLCSVDTYLSDIRRAIAAINPTPIVVAHSMGGFLMQHYIAQEPLPGLALLCSVPSTGAGRFTLDWARRHPLAVLKTLLTLNGRHLVGTTELAHEAFFPPDMPRAEVEAHAARIGPEAARMALEMAVRLPAARPGETPMLVVAAELDRVFTLKEQRATAAVYGAPLVVVPGAAHDLMLDPRWPQAADAIAQAAEGWAN